MYEHPYLAYKVTEFDQEQLRQAVERRRFVKEHAEQIVPRPAGALRRMWERMLHGSAAPRGEAARSRRSTGCATASAR
ncbi:hypothetical protein [Microbacterium sp. NPDC089695]|uniref:hypothetical protein n=1 Tax=Microbacterium sp. NPDC089695 TaxID=3364198 RepID=UPI00380A6B06